MKSINFYHIAILFFNINLIFVDANGIYKCICSNQVSGGSPRLLENGSTELLPENRAVFDCEGAGVVVAGLAAAACTTPITCTAFFAPFIADGNYIAGDFAAFLATALVPAIAVVIFPLLAMGHPYEPFMLWPDWCIDLPDEVTLDVLSLPGTHDTMARYGSPFAWTQHLPLYEQLNRGIRVTDIRMSLQDGEIYIYHGIMYQHATFRDVLNACTKFLDEQPTEFIIMGLKQEDDGNPEDLVLAVLIYVSMSEYSEYFYTSNLVPTVGQARGKIVIFDEMSLGLGIHYGSQDIQNDWELTDLDKKWGQIVTHLESSCRRNDTLFYITFLTASTTAFIWPITAAYKLNRRFMDYMKSNRPMQKLGIIMMDYPRPQLIEHIIMNNVKGFRGC